MTHATTITPTALDVKLANARIAVTDALGSYMDARIARGFAPNESENETLAAAAAETAMDAIETLLTPVANGTMEPAISSRRFDRLA